MLTESNFILFAAKNYNNPDCHTVEEFQDDLSRLKYLKKVFRRYRVTGDINVRLTLNYFITFYNLFGVSASNTMMFFKLKDYYDVLKPFLLLLNYLPERVDIGKAIIRTSDIVMDPKIVEELRKI